MSPLPELGTTMTPLSPEAGAAMSPVPQSTAFSSVESVMSEVTDNLVTVISAMNPVRSNQIVISTFDPSLHHDFSVWCMKLIMFAISINGMIASEKRDFQTLYNRRVDIANILFEIRKTDFNHYPTYPKYVRRSLLRSRIVECVVTYCV